MSIVNSFPLAKAGGACIWPLAFQRGNKNAWSYTFTPPYWVQLSEAFKEGHAAKSAEGRRHSNHNMRAHLGEIYNNSNNQSSSFPNNNKS
jgi:hypothetical protein